MEKKWHDPELGTIILRSSPRNKRYSLRIVNTEIIATMPPKGSEKRMIDFIEENRQKLLQLKQRLPSKPILDETTNLQTATFRLQITREERSNFRPVLKEGILQIFCPQTIRFEDERVQQLLKEILTNVFRIEAKRVLPWRLQQLARQHGFTFSNVSIKNTRTRWGSCSSTKSINLSLWLMQLPWHLIDYILLHELCHTIEMNHSDRFWALMDKVTDGQAKALRKELKNYQSLS